MPGAAQLAAPGHGARFRLHRRWLRQPEFHPSCPASARSCLQRVASKDALADTQQRTVAAAAEVSRCCWPVLCSSVKGATPVCHSRCQASRAACLQASPPTASGWATPAAPSADPPAWRNAGRCSWSGQHCRSAAATASTPPSHRRCSAPFTMCIRTRSPHPSLFCPLLASAQLTGQSSVPAVPPLHRRHCSWWVGMLVASFHALGLGLGQFPALSPPWAACASAPSACINIEVAAVGTPGK